MRQRDRKETDDKHYNWKLEHNMADELSQDKQQTVSRIEC